MTTLQMNRGNKTPESEEFLERLYRGGELLASGNLEEAKDHLEVAHQLQPKNEKSQNLLGLTYFKLGHYERAAEIYELLIRENPVEPTLRVNLGLVYLKTQALQRAVREFETATDLAPDHKKAHNYLGLALAQAGEYGRAREHFFHAGNEQMAEKMARAIEEEVPPAPQEAPPAPAEEVVAEAAREEAPADDAAARPEELSASEAYEAAQDETVRGEDWGAQFGLEEPPAPAQASEDELRFAEDEGPSALTPVAVQGDEDLPVLPTYAEEATETDFSDVQPDAPLPSPLTYEEQLAQFVPEQEAYVAQTETQDEPFIEQEVAPAPSLALEDSEPLGDASLGQAFAETERMVAAVPVPRITAPEEGLPTAIHSRQERPVPALHELAADVTLLAASAEKSFEASHGGFSLAVNGELLTRMEGLMAFSGALTFYPETQRFRGRATDQPFGRGTAQMTRASGQGVLYLEPRDRTFLAVDLAEVPAYFLSECLFAFEHELAFENGQLGGEEEGVLELVQLRGRGRVLLSLPGSLRSIPVRLDEPVTVPLSHLVGWQGALAPQMVSLSAPGQSERNSAAVELSGEGFALLALPVR